MDKTGAAREEKAKAKAGLGPRLSKGLWTWPEIKVSGTAVAQHIPRR